MADSIKHVRFRGRGESTRSRMSWICASAFCSSSVGLGAMLELDENCE